MAEIAIGLLLGVLLGAQWNWPRESTLVLGAVLAVAVYLVSCARWPYRACWWCGGRTTRRGQPGHTGNYRRRRACWLCGGGDYRRLGARLLGRG